MVHNAKLDFHYLKTNKSDPGRGAPLARLSKLIGIIMPAKRTRAARTYKKKTYRKKYTNKATAYNALQRVLTKYHDLNNNITVGITPVLYNLTSGLGMGSNQNQYVGTAIQPLCLTIRIIPYCNATVCYMRFIVFQCLSSSTPLATDVLQTGLGNVITCPVRHMERMITYS
jgi:hypothetical protein